MYLFLYSHNLNEIAVIVDNTLKKDVMLFLLFNGMKKAKYRFSNKCSIPGLYDERHHLVRRKKF